MNAGSTWLYTQLRRRPALWPPPIGERHYFAHREVMRDRRIGIYGHFLRGSVGEIASPVRSTQIVARSPLSRFKR